MVGHVHEGLEPLNYGLAALEQRDRFDGESLLAVARGEDDTEPRVGACQLLRVNLQHNVLDASKGGL